MPQIIKRPVQAALPGLAEMYGASVSEFQAMAEQLTEVWQVLDDAGEVLGTVALRPSPMHGAELMGGAAPGVHQLAVAGHLLQAAHGHQPQLYAYADPQRFPAEALTQAGWSVVGAYTLLAGPTPTQPAQCPAGFSIRPISESPDPDDWIRALASYEDRIGHHAVAPDRLPEAVRNWFDADVSVVAYDTAGTPAGLCRAAIQDTQASIDAPGVQPPLRGTGLRQALLLSVCERLSHRGVTHITLEAWGDTPEERADDLALGLTVQELTPIYAALVDDSSAGVRAPR
ncbi:GNAT family N-acetyltransferase [Deinococcus sonorensis]|uniref:GNAT family N-acetyltransferase n=2 Tax=Deinococcus sonorensis TaxID=309891 RepID=A0AAU7UDH9_9DEIO